MAESQTQQSGQEGASEASEGPKPQAPSAGLQYLILRRSAVFLALFLGGLELIYVVMITLLASLTAGPLSTVALSVLGTAKFFLMLWVISSWHSEYYEVRPGEVIHHRGVLSKRVEVFSCRDVREIVVQQGFIGKLMHFGTIFIYSPALDQKVYLRDIANPNKHLEILAQLMPGVESDRVTFLHQAGGGVE